MMLHSNKESRLALDCFGSFSGDRDNVELVGEFHDGTDDRGAIRAIALSRTKA
jgi:hypothetical protein